MERDNTEQTEQIFESLLEKDLRNKSVEEILEIKNELDEKLINHTMQAKFLIEEAYKRKDEALYHYQIVQGLSKMDTVISKVLEEFGLCDE